MRAFLYKVANNLIIDESRKKKEESLQALLEESDVFEPSDEGHRAIERRALFNEVLESIHALPHEDRTILIMRYVDDLDLQEIAEALGISVNNVSVKINRMIALLRKNPKLQNPNFQTNPNEPNSNFETT